jgi:hypothetical protein
VRGSLPRAGRAPTRGLALAMVLLAAPACRGGSTGADGSSTGAEAESGSTAGAGTTFGMPDACMSSEECETSGHCIAPYDPAPDEGTAMRGAAACVDACIEEDDLQRWCLDDDACCGELRCNAVDGFCERPRPIGESSSGTAGDASTTSSGTLGETSSSSDSGSTAESSSTGDSSSGDSSSGSSSG